MRLLARADIARVAELAGVDCEAEIVGANGGCDLLEEQFVERAAYQIDCVEMTYISGALDDTILLTEKI